MDPVKKIASNVDGKHMQKLGRGRKLGSSKLLISKNLTFLSIKNIDEQVRNSTIQLFVIYSDFIFNFRGKDIRFLYQYLNLY